MFIIISDQQYINDSLENENGITDHALRVVLVPFHNLLESQIKTWQKFEL